MSELAQASDDGTRLTLRLVLARLENDPLLPRSSREHDDCSAAVRDGLAEERFEQLRDLHARPRGQPDRHVRFVASEHLVRVTRAQVCFLSPSSESGPPGPGARLLQLLREYK